MEFIVPDVLQPWKLPERYRGATFDREQAIRRSDADFLALGHPLVEAMLEYAGSYDFGGLATLRRINDPQFAGRCGCLFLFVVRERIAHESGDECLFQLHPVFVDKSGTVDAAAAAAAVKASVKDDKTIAPESDLRSLFDAARQYLETKFGIWGWEDDVEFIGLSWVEFR